MNDKIKMTINHFLNNVANAGNKLETFSEEISAKDTKLSVILDDFSKFLNNISIEKNNNEFATHLQEMLTLYQDKCAIWTTRINSYIHGKQFINQFEKSVLFVVFGNVNVGKSSIGNFIAGCAEELKPYYAQQPDFYVYDFAGQTCDNNIPVKMEDCFKENFTEETTTIQYYTLKNGLTWVDSPGIHSINDANETLAKKYVDYADLVLFVMTSSSPAKYDEFMELNRLIEKKKPLLVVINKSDKKEYDEIDGNMVEKLIPKSPADRKKQENYVKELFDDNPNISYAQKLDSISISIYLARQALRENDEACFDDSGLPKFYQMLGTTLEENALELKTQAPRQRVNSLINEILNGFNLNDENIDGIKNMYASFDSVLKNIEKKIAEIRQLDISLLEDVRICSIGEIDLAVSKASASLQGGDMPDLLEDKIEKIILKHFNSSLQKRVAKLLSDFRHNNINSLDIHLDAQLKAKYETFTHQEYSVKEVSRSPEGILEHIGSFFGAKYTRVKTITHTVENKIIVGDNSGEIVDNIINNLERELQPVVSAILNNIAQNYFEKEKEIVTEIVQKLDNAEKSLLQEMM